MDREKTKIIAFYLPQFHAIPENDEWWGEGFTEWTNVKRAKPLYRKHYQPRVPLHNHYYDLSDASEMVRQMEMAKKAGIGGFCFYHYWFNGKKLLEKPVERLLSTPEANLPFCLCWANEPWTRTWDGESGAKEILMAQEYGDETDWKEHFLYLLTFFQDSRYLKKDNKPVFVFYAINAIEKVSDMLEMWNELAVEHGFNGIYTISVNRGKVYDKDVDAVIDFEPFATVGSSNYFWEKYRREVPFEFLKNLPLVGKKYFPVMPYEEVAEKMVSKKVRTIKTHYLGSFVGWDNSARRGRKPLLIVEGGTPKQFEYYLQKQYQKSIQDGREFLFINAWNEWAEGTYLEPDQRYGFAYLNAVKRVVVHK